MDVRLLALNRHRVREFNPEDPHWGKRQAEERLMKAYMLIALVGLIACAVAAVLSWMRRCWFLQIRTTYRRRHISHDSP
jgi:hypothetical protein